MGNGELTVEELYGTWRLVESRAVDLHGAALRDPWGPEPMGVLIIERSGRMLAALCDGRSNLPEGEARAYSSYSGSFELSGNVFTTTIDAASDSSRIGTQQPRRLRSIDGKLVLEPPIRSDGEQRQIFWTRVTPS